MIDLNSGVLKIDDIEFDYNISINEFIKKFNKKVLHKPGLFDDKSKQIMLSIENGIFFTLPFLHLIIIFNNYKIEMIKIVPSFEAKDEYELYEKSKRWFIENLGNPINFGKKKDIEFYEFVEYTNKNFDILLSVNNDFKDLRLETEITMYFHEVEYD